MKTTLIPALLAGALALALCGCTREYTDEATVKSTEILRPGDVGSGGGPPPNGGGLPWPDPIADPNAPKQSNGGTGDLPDVNRIGK